MDDIKKVFKYTIIFNILIFILGILSMNKYLYLGYSLGIFISIIAFYIITIDTKKLSFIKDIKKAKKYTYVSFAKRYFLYFIFLMLIAKFFDESMFLMGALGLLTIKFVIMFIVFIKKIIKLKGG